MVGVEDPENDVASAFAEDILNSVQCTEEPTMKNRLTRRDFGKLSVAALGGVMAGATLTGCGGDGKDGTTPKTDAKDKKGASGPTGEKHACRGLNACKGQGAGGDNACAGQGACATAEKHGCHGKNACKGQGGCGANAAVNECKGKGGCAVPMTDKAMWEKARANFEAKMKEAGKEVGAAPAAPGA